MDPLTQDGGSTHPVLCMVSPPSKRFHYDSTYPEIWVFLTTPLLFICKKQTRIPLCTPNWPKILILLSVCQVLGSQVVFSYLGFSSCLPYKVLQDLVLLGP